ncbi:MAG: metallophosphoesterase [bacterium]
MVNKPGWKEGFMKITDDNNITRRQFLKLGIAAGALLCLPAPLSRTLAAEGDEPLLNEIMIRRLLSSEISDPVEFIFCADIHIPFDDRGVFRTIIKRANELAVSFVLFGGDCVQVGNTANFRIFLNLLKKFNMPVICAIGNHDTAYDDYSNQKEWKKRFGATHFLFNVDGIRIIALNNADFAMPEEDYKFLEESLKTDLQKIIVMHRPANYLNPLYTTPMEDKIGRFRALVENGGVTAVLTGHEHHYGYYEINGVKYIVSGGAGGKLNTTTENNYHHFLLIKAGREMFNFIVEKI